MDVLECCVRHIFGFFGFFGWSSNRVVLSAIHLLLQTVALSIDDLHHSLDPFQSQVHINCVVPLFKAMDLSIYKRVAAIVSVIKIWSWFSPSCIAG
ncbi:hypothetical protein Bca4012_064326 [Brassica carinata]